jgi:hypothetical protein
MSSNENENENNDEVIIDFEGHANRERVKQSIETIEILDTFTTHSLQNQKSIIRDTLSSIEVGTDCDKNDADPLGDGDQTPISLRTGADRAREIYSIGGDIHQHFVDNAITKFGMTCARGDVEAIRELISDIAKTMVTENDEEEEQRPWYCCDDEKDINKTKMAKLLETRETSMRLSPLLMIASAGKNINVGQSPFLNHKEVAKLLLKSGANPRAKDVLGKTVAHYGSGAFATQMTLNVVDMCVRAAYSSHMFGKNVELHKLNTKKMNGLIGVAGGYDPHSDRRAVYLIEEKKEVWVKPDNVRLVNSSISEDIEDCKPGKMLLDVQDRMLSVSLHEVLINDREDVAEFLIKKHGTSIHTEDMDGLSPMSMVTKGAQMSSRKVSKIISDVARREGKKTREEKKQVADHICAGCGKEDIGETGKQCTGCKMRVYCRRECQVSHWQNGHRDECKKLKLLSSGVKVPPPPPSGQSVSTISFTSGRSQNEDSYSKPTGVRTDEKFVVKVQGGTDVMPIMVYDESRTCLFDIKPGKPVSLSYLIFIC